MSDLRVTRLTGWGRATASRALVHAGVAAADLPALLDAAGRRGVLARGLGRSYGDAAQNGGGDVLRLSSRDTPVEVDTTAGAVRVPAAASIDELLRRLLPMGRCLPVMPGTRFVSVGGAIAADVHGKNHHVDGSFGRWVRELSLVDGCGRERVLSPGAQPAEFWATLGGMGLTGVVTSAVIATLPVSTTQMRVRSRRFSHLDAVLDAMTASEARYHVAWVDAAPGSGFGRSVLDEADHLDGGHGGPARHAPRTPLPVPLMPLNLVRPAAIRLFNEAWWRRAPTDSTTTVPLARYFHPLDGLGDWHRLYGPAGLLQWQIAVPFSARQLVEASLRRLVAAAAVPSLVVLKRFGEPSPGPLSFPIAGWTLAVDLPAGYPGLRRVLDTLDEQVADAGGRVYFAKDARLSPRLLARMYPDVDSWRAVRQQLDPRGVFQSDLGRRLRLV